MDPFTEKLLERTRARRENLQKKMAERPTAANRQTGKRSREPLSETNSVISQPTTDKVLPSSKPSPSKRRCSEENKDPVVLNATALEPNTDKKPPIPPVSIQPTTTERKVVQPTMVPSRSPLDSEKKANSSLVKSTECTNGGLKCSAVEEVKENFKEAPENHQPAKNMKSRLQRLAEQRQYWDADGDLEPISNSVELSPPKSQKMELPINPVLTSEKPLGRKGRLANLAATINSWEDDLGHQPICKDNTQGQPGTACVPRAAHMNMSTGVKPSAAAHKPALGSVQTVTSKSAHRTQQPPVHSPVKLSNGISSSPRRTEVSEPKQVKACSPVPSTVKNYSSQPSTPVKSGKVLSSETTPASHSHSKPQVPCKNLETRNVSNLSPVKANFPTKPSSASVSAAQTSDRSKNTTPLKHSGPVGTPGGVKSFLERFGERCQERNQGSPLGSGTQNHTTPVPPSSTNKSKLLQERLAVTQGNSSTAILTQKQKMEREAELAQVRNRFQNNKVSKSKEDLTEAKADLESKVLEDACKRSPPKSEEKPTSSLLSLSDVPQHSEFSDLEKSNPEPVSPKPAEFSEEKDVQSKKEIEEEVYGREMNVDASVNSEVINELFEGVLEENEEHDEENEEEDPLNISSMSLLTPLAETVAAVVKSPERKVMTSTPASSFLEKSRTPEGVSRHSKFQRAQMLRAGSSDSIEAKDEDQKLPYSIDAYRSIRVKETERPQVKQVIVRKEDVSKKMEEPRHSGHISLKQKMQALINEMNMQQTVIHQASQALNCCTDEEHGKGTPVEAEAERLLLISTEKRGALKAEIDRLKVEGPAAQKKSSARAQDDMGVSASKGSITLQELRLPLKADFVCSTANRPESGNHYFFVMIRAGAENTVATALASTNSALSGDALSFSIKFTLLEVSSDFQIDVEVYYLAQKRDVCSDKRKKPMKSKAMTPKRFLAITKTNSQTPVMASPGGPNAVRTSNFVLVGSHKLTLGSIGKNKFQLEKMKYEGSEISLLSDMFQNKVPFLCPLEGHIYLKMQCEVNSHVEERGFLTMFEDVSGFGAWHRRWCLLSGYYISYWTYPDDEKRKNPIGRINLASCTSRKVEPANREFCARPNTFELITVRPQKDDDKETLVSQCHNTMCVTKNWLSADTKEERNLWMRKLNQILVDLRMWQPDSCYRPV